MPLALLPASEPSDGHLVFQACLMDGWQPSGFPREARQVFSRHSRCTARKGEWCAETPSNHTAQPLLSPPANQSQLSPGPLSPAGVFYLKVRFLKPGGIAERFAFFCCLL